MPGIASCRRALCRSETWLAQRLARLLLLGWAALCGPAAATSLDYCDPAAKLNAVQQDRLLRFAAIVRHELDALPDRAVLIARSGLDLDRFAVRYSHAGVSLRDSPNTPWSVRQLYFACEERVPRLYDQGIAGFVQGTHDARLGYVSVILLSADDGAALASDALDDRRALRLLGATYSANAHAFDTRYQNCNQWLAELLAAAWGGLAGDATGEATGDNSLRARAQRWLRARGYVPHAFEVGSRLLMALGAFVPWLHADDHPEADLQQAVYRVSMPDAIEAFVQRTRPGARRIEFCHDEHRVVIRRGWEPIAEGCVAVEGDAVIGLD